MTKFGRGIWLSREQFFKIYLRQSRKGIGIFFLFCAVFLCIFLLYDLPAGAVVYPALICSVLGAGVLVRGYYSAYQKHRELDRIAQLSSELMEHFPEKTTAADWDYQEVIGHLREEQRSLKNRLDMRYTDMMEYYTVWVHQIKTPIASMRLMLQNEDSDQARRLSEELSRIEQYVEMVLVYLRLDSESKDHVFRKCDLDQIVRGEVKKFAGQFIRRKIGLRYEPLDCEVLTDEKWLAFVVEQVISNALKYTEEGRSRSHWKNRRRSASGIPGSGSLRKICRVFLKRDIPDITGAPIRKRVASGSTFAEESVRSLGIGSGQNLRPVSER